TATKLGTTVTIVTPSVEPMIRPLGALLAAELRRRLEAEGITFELGAEVTGFEGEDRVTGVALADGRSIPADVVIEAIGSTCNVEWLAGSALDLSDGVLADNALRAVTEAGDALD